MEIESHSLTFTNHPDHIQEQILDMDAKFQRACKQVVLMNSFVKALQCRYDKAVKQNLRSYRYHLRLRLCVSEGVRNAYYEYATEMADKIEILESQLEQQGVQPIVLYPEADFSDNSLDTDDMDV